MPDLATSIFSRLNCSLIGYFCSLLSYFIILVTFLKKMLRRQQALGELPDLTDMRTYKVICRGRFAP